MLKIITKGRKVEYPRNAVIIEEGKGKVVTLKDPVEDLSHSLRYGEMVYVPDDFTLPEK